MAGPFRLAGEAPSRMPASRKNERSSPDKSPEACASVSSANLTNPDRSAIGSIAAMPLANAASGTPSSRRISASENACSDGAPCFCPISRSSIKEHPLSKLIDRKTWPFSYRTSYWVQAVQTNPCFSAIESNCCRVIDAKSGIMFASCGLFRLSLPRSSADETRVRPGFGATSAAPDNLPEDLKSGVFCSHRSMQAKYL
jgi:hypothetical protein